MFENLIARFQVRRGLKKHLNRLDIAELGWCTDTAELFIGNLDGNVLVGNPEINNIALLGRFTVTPLVNGMSCDFRLDFPIKSVKFGYYALEINGKTYTEAVPVNQPLQTSAHAFEDYSRLSIVFYDLRSILMDDDMDFSGMGWDFLLNQKWFEVVSTSPISLRLVPVKIGEINGVQFGPLKRLED